MPASEIIDCALCGGTGSRDWDGKDPKCETCGGSGKVFIRIPWVTCGMCNGTGSRDSDKRPPACSRCGGVGAIPADELKSY